MLEKLKRNKSGVLYVYLVLIICLAAGIFFGFLFMNVVGVMQESINPLLAESNWASATHFTTFYYASLFVTNFWQYIVAFVVFVVAFWAYIYSQRRGAGYQ